MKIVTNTSDKFKIRHNPIVVKLFLYPFLILGIVNFYKRAMGISVDLDDFGIFLFIIIPLVALCFIFHRVVIEVDNKNLIVSRYYLMRRKKEYYPLSKLKNLYIRKARGGSAAGGSLRLIIEDGEVGIIYGPNSLFTSIGKAAGSEEVRELKKRLNLG